MQWKEKNSFAYQDNKGTSNAANQVCDFLNEGYIWSAEIDIKQFFDNISQEKLLQILDTFIDDVRVMTLIKSYITCKVMYAHKVETKTKGLVQGSPLSPLLSNLYLNELDYDLELKELKFCRFADDINIYVKNLDEANKVYNYLCSFIKEKLDLDVNKEKSGVFQAPKRRYLGFEFLFRKDCGYIAIKNKKFKEHYNTWHTSAIQRVDKDYHIINDGILTRRDFTVLFENEEGKKYLPVETMGSLNVYSEVTFTSGFFEYANTMGLKIAIYDRYGRFVGNFMSYNHSSTGTSTLRQAALYNDTSRRVGIAKTIITAAMHNMRANLRYYNKNRSDLILKEAIKRMDENITKVKNAQKIEEILMIEARNRQQYYQCFNSILQSEAFVFEKRTKRPPRDAINAMISFGNMCLYERIATEMYKHQIDIRIGFLHSTNKRSQSLNLDVAELFKPIIVDRTIFTLINKGMIHALNDFEKTQDGGIYLNKHGKRIFIQEYQNKLYQKITYQDQKMTYDTLIRKEINKIFRLIHYGEKYKPYKYI
ncbi:MAG: type I-B CRISPR-associated endonuclease Cas1b [Lachnospiraceae bacterium]|nr:type I-B CRISPR-associated endonuclease Cas1b [Lachnospiraceae bacterium]